MVNFIQNLRGYKTYGLAVIAAIIFASARLGWITADQEIETYKLLGIGAVMTIRDAISQLKAS